MPPQTDQWVDVPPKGQPQQGGVSGDWEDVPPVSGGQDITNPSVMEANAQNQARQSLSDRIAQGPEAHRNDWTSQISDNGQPLTKDNATTNSLKATGEYAGNEAALYGTALSGPTLPAIAKTTAKGIAYGTAGAYGGGKAGGYLFGKTGENVGKVVGGLVGGGEGIIGEIGDRIAARKAQQIAAQEAEEQAQRVAARDFSARVGQTRNIQSAAAKQAEAAIPPKPVGKAQSHFFNIEAPTPSTARMDQVAGTTPVQDAEAMAARRSTLQSRMQPPETKRTIPSLNPPIYESEAQYNQLQRLKAQQELNAKDVGMYHAAEGSVKPKTTLPQRIGKRMQLPVESFGQRAATASPADLAQQAGLRHIPGNDVFPEQFEAPDHPGKTIAVSKRDMATMTPQELQRRMAEKLAQNPIVPGGGK